MTTATPTSTAPTTTTPDFAAIKERQRATWASGDYAAVAASIPIISELLCDAADLRAGWRVLDVAGGSGNTALAAARCGADVTSLDYVPSLQERGRQRAGAEGLEVTWVEGDAEALPFPDGAFDATISGVGVMFAPNQPRAAAELLRVTRPGGTIAVASWTPDGFIGQLLATVGRYVPPPAGLVSPARWGVEEHVRELFGAGVSQLRARTRTYAFRYRSPEHFVDFFREFYGPVHKAFAALDHEGAAALAVDIADLARRFDRLNEAGAVAVAGDYLEVVATRA